MTSRIDKMASLLEALKTRKLADFVAVAARRNILVAKLDKYRQAKVSIANQICSNTSITNWSFSETRLRWLDQQIEVHNTTLARIAADFERLKLEAAKAIGRHEAFNQVLQSKFDRNLDSE